LRVAWRSPALAAAAPKPARLPRGVSGGQRPRDRNALLRRQLGRGGCAPARD